MFTNLTKEEVEQHIIKDLLLAQTGGRVQSTCVYKHHIHTPFALCEEILDQIDHALCSTATKYLVMFNLEFLYSLKKYIDFGEDRVYYYTTDTNKARLAKMLCPTVEIVADLNECIMDENGEEMKFDVIVGNPPYQSGKDNSDKLWPIFIEKCMSKTNENGYMSLVCPDTWTSGTKSVCQTGRKNILSDIMLKNNPLIFNFNISQHFKGIGSSFSYFVIQRAEYLGSTRIKTARNDFEANLTGFECLLKNPSEISLSIATKVFNNGKPFEFKFVAGQDIDYTDMWDNEHQHYFFNANSNRKNMWGSRKNGPTVPKVHMRYLGTNFAFDYDINGNNNIMHNGRIWILPTNIVTSEEICKSVFESKLIKFLVHNNKWGQYNEPKIINQIPVIDLTRIWTDKELYDHFGLTKEERLHIDPAYID